MHYFNLLRLFQVCICVNTYHPCQQDISICAEHVQYTFRLEPGLVTPCSLLSYVLTKDYRQSLVLTSYCGFHNCSLLYSVKMSKKYTQRFRVEWLNDPQCKNWIYKVSGNYLKYLCKYCIVTAHKQVVPKKYRNTNKKAGEPITSQRVFDNKKKK